MATIAVWVSEHWRANLDAVAKERRVSVSQVIAEAIQAHFGFAPMHFGLRDRDGKEKRAMAILRASPDLSIREVVLKLKAAGINRGKTWVHQKRQLLSYQMSAHPKGNP